MIHDLASTLPPEEVTWLLLGAYQLTSSYEEWCLDVGLDPKTDLATETYLTVHVGYADIWRELGTDLFFARLEQYTSRWRTLRRASERTGNRTLVGRLTRGRTA